MGINHEQCQSCSSLCYEYRITPTFTVEEWGFNYEEAQQLVENVQQVLCKLAALSTTEFTLVQGYFTSRPALSVGYVDLHIQIHAANSVGIAGRMPVVVLPAKEDCGVCPF